MSLLSALDEGGWLTPGSYRYTAGIEISYPLYRRLLGLYGPSGGVRKIGRFYSPYKEDVNKVFDVRGVFRKRRNFLNSAPTSIESALQLLSAPSVRF